MQKKFTRSDELIINAGILSFSRRHVMFLSCLFVFTYGRRRSTNGQSSAETLAVPGFQGSRGISYQGGDAKLHFWRRAQGLLHKRCGQC